MHKMLHNSIKGKFHGTLLLLLLMMLVASAYMNICPDPLLDSFAWNTFAFLSISAVTKCAMHAFDALWLGANVFA